MPSTPLLPSFAAVGGPHTSYTAICCSSSTRYIVLATFMMLSRATDLLSSCSLALIVVRLSAMNFFQVAHGLRFHLYKEWQLKYHTMETISRDGEPCDCLHTVSQ
jgi:hypothetical protein